MRQVEKLMFFHKHMSGPKKGRLFSEVTQEALTCHWIAWSSWAEEQPGCWEEHHPGQWLRQRAVCSIPRRCGWPAASVWG